MQEAQWQMLCFFIAILLPGNYIFNTKINCHFSNKGIGEFAIQRTTDTTNYEQKLVKLKKKRFAFWTIFFLFFINFWSKKNMKSS